jgi:hypothetical protein
VPDQQILSEFVPGTGARAFFPAIDRDVAVQRNELLERGVSISG